MQRKFSASRRRVLKGLALAAAGPFPARRGRAEDPATREKLFQFRYSDVKLTGGSLKEQFDRIHASYLGLDEDGLLKEFRQRAGLPAPGEFPGGWYDRDGFAPGHSFGQYVSGLARFADATGDAATRAKVGRLVEGFGATVAVDGNCYPNKKASTTFPAYIYDKYLIGLLDASRFAGISPALDVLDRTTKDALRHLPPRALDRQSEQLKESPYDESYTLAENLFYAHEVTGRKEYFELAKKYLLDRTYFEPLARGENVLPGRHAYSHVNALSSAARAYLALGEPKYLETVRNAWEMIEKTQEFASGGWGPNETFVRPNEGLVGKSIASTHAHFETPCGAYAHFKLARYLLRFTAQARYGDSLERALYNTVLGAKDPSGDGYFFYYSDYHSSARKDYFPDKYPCCSGTLPQVVADYAISAYFWNQEGIFVNLFTPSEVSWKADGGPARLIQKTAYPESDSIELRLELPSPGEFTLFVRVPGWLEAKPEFSLNDRSLVVEAWPGTFAAIKNENRWRSGDRIQIKLPFSFRTKRVDAQHPDLVGVMRGPLMLVALDPKLKLARQALRDPGAIKPAPRAPQSFELQAPSQELVFVPFYAVKDETYTTYLERA